MFSFGFKKQTGKNVAVTTFNKNALKNSKVSTNVFLEPGPNFTVLRLKKLTIWNNFEINLEKLKRLF